MVSIIYQNFRTSRFGVPELSENPHGNWQIKNVNSSDYLGPESQLYHYVLDKEKEVIQCIIVHRPCSSLDIEVKRFNQTEAIRESAKNI